MYQLPNNFTGLNVEPIKLEIFKSICYSLQGLGLLAVNSISGYEYPNNYYVASVSDQDGEYKIYFNCFSGVMAFGQISDEQQLFLSKPSIAAAIDAIKSQCIVIPVDTLRAEVSNKNLKSLDTVVKIEVERWLPSSVGGLLFTWYFD